MAAQVLVVDDEPDIVELIRYHLEKAGYRCLAGADGAAALRLVRERQPDLLILDLMLPGLDGLEVCRQLRRDPGTARLPIIMLTAKAEEVDRVVGLEIGFNRLFGTLVGLGLGLPHNYLLQVRGRRSGRLHSTPVNVLEHSGKRFLVAGRGATQWVRNARASGQVALRKGCRREAFRLREVPDSEKPEVLKAYLDRFALSVQRYFPVRAGSALEEFAPLAGRYPVFGLTPSPPPPPAGERVRAGA